MCVDGVKGKAFSFDGNGSTITVPSTQDLKISKTITISALVLVDQDDSKGFVFVQKGQSGVIWDYGLGSYYSYPSYRSWDADWYSDNVKTLTSNHGQYHLLTTVVDENNSTNPISTYLDGLKIDGKILGNQSISSPSHGFINQSDYPLVIGVGHPNQKLKGKIDDLRIYNRALTEAEVLELYKGTVEVFHNPPPAVLVPQTGTVETPVVASGVNATPVFDPTKLPKVVNMNNATCRYVAPFYETTWKLMNVKTAPNCNAVLRYHTWLNSTRPDNLAAATYLSNRLNKVETDNTLFNQRMAQFDEGVSAVFDSILMYDLGKKVFRQKDATVNIMKKAGILQSLKSREAIFKASTVYGDGFNKGLEKIFVDEGLIKYGTQWLCGALIEDSKTSTSCANEAKKASTCAKLVVSKGAKAKLDSTAILKDSAECIIGGVTTTISAIGNWWDVGTVTFDLKPKIEGYNLIDDYLDDYYKSGKTQYPNDDEQLKKDIRTYVSSYPLFLDIDFIMKGIRSSITRNNEEGTQNVKTAENARKSFEQYIRSRDIVNGLDPNS